MLEQKEKELLEKERRLMLRQREAKEETKVHQRVPSARQAFQESPRIRGAKQESVERRRVMDSVERRRRESIDRAEALAQQQ